MKCKDCEHCTEQFREFGYCNIFKTVVERGLDYGCSAREEIAFSGTKLEEGQK
jgi:hypothetical protein